MTYAITFIAGMLLGAILIIAFGLALEAVAIEKNRRQTAEWIERNANS